MTTPLISPAPPNLPVAPVTYEGRFQDQFSNTLRLYFNQLKNLTDTLVSLATQFENGTYGQTIKFPYFSAYQDGLTTLTADIPTANSTADIHVASTADFLSAGYFIIEEEIIEYTGKTATTFTGITRGALGTNTGKSAHSLGSYVSEAAAVAVGSSSPMLLDVVTVSNKISFTPVDSKVYLDDAGLYNIQFSVQLLNYSTTIDDVRVWLVKNGNIVDYSAGLIEVQAKHGSIPGAVIASWNYVESFNADEYFELYWRSVSGETVIATYPPGTSPTRPASPGLILTVTFVSALPTA